MWPWRTWTVRTTMFRPFTSSSRTSRRIHRNLSTRSLCWTGWAKRTVTINRWSPGQFYHHNACIIILVIIISTRTFGKISVDAPGFTPWYDVWMKLYLQSLPTVEHEYLKHHLGGRRMLWIPQKCSYNSLNKSAYVVQWVGDYGIIKKFSLLQKRTLVNCEHWI